ncbi:Raftlin-2 [Varanus komodoensis]|nr:Raftlin-2 [Varanus komodoensis]
MGCGLRKLEDPDDSSPGKIFSTLKRPQVETKTDSAYEYILLDFALEGSSNPDVIKISSVLDIAKKVEEYYTKGYIVVAIHPVLLSIGRRRHFSASYIYRVVLLRLKSSQKQPPSRQQRYPRLVIEECTLTYEKLTNEVVKGLLEKQAAFCKCAECGSKMSPSDPHDLCLLCPGEGHRTDKCFHCLAFSKQARKNCENRQRRLPWDQALMQSDPLVVALKPGPTSVVPPSRPSDEGASTMRAPPASPKKKREKRKHADTKKSAKKARKEKPPKLTQKLKDPERPQHRDSGSMAASVPVAATVPTPPEPVLQAAMRVTPQGSPRHVADLPTEPLPTLQRRSIYSDDSDVDSTSPDVAVTSQGPASPDKSHVSFVELMSRLVQSLDIDTV